MAGDAEADAGGGSTVLEWLDHVERRITAALVGSVVARRLSRWGRRLGRVVRSSWVSRWLTAEPEPEVIVIDLRETWTVGPIIAVLDRVIDRIAAWRTGSHVVWYLRDAGKRVRAAPIRSLGWMLVTLGAMWIVVAGLEADGVRVGLAALLVLLGLLLTRDTRSLDEVRATKWYRVLAAAFEPPEPPDRER